MNTALCRCGCGRPAVCDDGFAGPCRKRWYKAGRPAVLPPPMTQAQRTAMARAAKDEKARERDAEVLPPDAYDLEWARTVRQRLASAPDRRAGAMQPVATDLIGCVGRRDARGIRELLAKIRADARGREPDWDALVVVLADRAAWVDGERRVIWSRQPGRAPSETSTEGSAA